MNCRACGEQFDDWKELAKHIVSKKDREHRKGRLWASKVLMQTRRLDSKKDLPERVKLTEEEKENKKSTVREISGETELVSTWCPHCKRTGVANLEVEYTQSGVAWQRNNKYVLMCNVCRG